jgi:parvulin-like peptidyl-prolyl isomerase
LNVNEISKPVKTAQGYSIIKLESKVQKPLLTEYEFQNKKAHLEKVLRIKKKIPAEQEFINTVFKRSDLTFDENVLRDILSGTFNNENPESDNPDKYQQECVSYKERKYSRQEIEDKIFTLPDEHVRRINSIEVLKAVVEGLLVNEILYAMAVDKGYASVETVKEMIEGYNKNIFLKHKVNYITQNSSLSDSVLIKFYKDNIHSFSKERELNLQEILVDNQHLADSLMSLIKNGQDFGKLANEFSLRKWSAENNGVMGFGPISRFGSYKDLFWKSEIGELIGPIQIENMYGIFRVLGKTDSKPIDFEIVKSEVLKAARSENQTEAVREYVGKMKKKINVSININLLGSYNILG